MEKILGLAIKTKTISGIVAGEKIGLQIVTGATELSREPEQTKKHSAKPILELDVSKEMIAATAEKVKHILNYRKAFKDEGDQLEMKAAKENELSQKQSEKIEVAKKHAVNPAQFENALKDADCVIADCELKIEHYTKKAAAANKKYLAEQGAAEAANGKLKEVEVRYKKAEKDFKRENPIFCEPGAGELVDSDIRICVPDGDGLPVVKTAASIDGERIEADNERVSFLIPDMMVTDEDEEGNPVEVKLTAGILTRWFFGKGDNEQIKTDGKAVEDFRGTEYFYNDGDIWIKSEKITDLGVTKETVVVDGYEEQACTFDQLEPEYKEEWRFQNLTVEQKTAEYDQKKAALLNESINLRLGWEVEGVTKTKALSDSQAFYNEGLAALNLKYGVA